MTANIEINTARDPAIELMATVFAKPDLYFVAGNAGFKLRHLRHLPSRCREIMQRYAEALDRTDNWEAVVDVFRQRDPGFFRWLNARGTPVGVERVNELVAEVIAASNGSLNGTTGPLSNGGSVGTAYTSSDEPLPSELTRWTTLTYVDAAGAMCTTMASDNAKIEHFPGIRRIDPETGLAEPEPPASAAYRRGLLLACLLRQLPGDGEEPGRIYRRTKCRTALRSAYAPSRHRGHHPAVGPIRSVYHRYPV